MQIPHIDFYTLELSNVWQILIFGPRPGFKSHKYSQDKSNMLYFSGVYQNDVWMCVRES